MSEHKAADASCPPTTQAQAVTYMNNEIIWARIIVLAWQNAEVMALLVANKDNANAVVQEISEKWFGMKGTIPPGVTLKVAFDSPTEVHLLMPSTTYIPCGPLDMVPHSL
jgi:hypothetical protein